jgi:hypothetical protein
MLHKIQPQQLNLNFFSSPSGDIQFQNGENYVYGNISRNLTGIFNVTGSLLINGIAIQTPDSSNSISGSGLRVLGGKSNTLRQDGNVAVNSNNSFFYGSGNLDLNGISSSFETGTKSNTILAGRNCTILSGSTGAVLLKDQSTAALSNTGNNSFASYFTGGYRILGGSVYLEQNTTFGQNFYVSSTKSGVFSGDARVLGNLYFGTGIVAKKYDLDVLSGTVVSNKAAQDSLSGMLYTISGQFTGVSGRLNTLSGYVTGISGKLDTVSGRVDSISGKFDALSGAFTGLRTGFSIISGSYITTSGQVTSLIANSIFRTGNQAITGIKTFADTAEFPSGISFGISSAPAYNAAGQTNQFYITNDLLHVYNGVEWVRFTGELGYV